MLSVSQAFQNKVLNNPTYLQWNYTVNINGLVFDSTQIKSIDISGQLQSEFTIGSSLSKSLEFELLISEKTNISENSPVDVHATLILDNGTEETINLGRYVITEIDRSTYGRLKIIAVDVMGHPDYLSSKIDATIFPVGISNIQEIVDNIAEHFGLSVIPIENNYVITGFDSVLLNFSYRQLLEYLAGYCGCNVRIVTDNNLQYIEFFRFRDTGVTLTKNNYYNMVKGQYLFRPTGISCTMDDSETILLGSGKESSTIKINNPFMTELQLSELYELFCYYEGKSSSYVEYYPITTDIIGTCLFEPGDIVTITDIYDDTYKIYIQDYKLSGQNGIKETLVSYFDYTKGNISNSISGRITRLNNELEDTKTYFAENYVSTTQFETTVEDLKVNVQYANDGLNKWIVEYYNVGSEIEDYDLEAVLGKEYARRELIEDANALVTGNIYENTVCRFMTGVYITPENGALLQDCYFRTSDGANVYLNGAKIANRALSTEDYPITFNSGWNILEIYTGGRNDSLSVITSSFRLKFENTESLDPYYHLSSTITEEEKEENTYRTLVINYLDFDTNSLIHNYREKFKINSQYDASDKVLNYVSGYYYFYTKDELSGTITDTTYINLYYTHRDRRQVITNYYIEGTTDKIKDIEYKTESMESDFFVDASKFYLDTRQFKYVDIIYRENQEDHLFQLASGGATIVSSSRKFAVNAYYDASTTISISVSFIAYSTKELLSTETYSYDYGTLFAEISVPNSLSNTYNRIIGIFSEDISNDGPGLGYSIPSRKKTLYDIRDGNVYRAYVMKTNEVYFEITNINSDDNFSETFFEVITKNTDIYYSYYGAHPALTDSSYIFEFFRPNSKYSAPFRLSEATLTHDGEILDMSNVVKHLYVTSDVNVVIVYHESDSQTFNLLPSLDEDTETENTYILPSLDEDTETETENTYSRFPFVIMVNPYVIDINYKRVTEVERLTTAKSIIDRITEVTYQDDNGSEINGVDYLLRSSEVVQEVDNITQTILEYDKTIEETTEKMSEVTQTVDGFKLTFDTALYGNYLSNSSFSTDDPLAGFNFTTPNKYDYDSKDLFTYRSDIEQSDGTIKTTTVSPANTTRYSYLKQYDYYNTLKALGFKGIVPSDNENAYSSSNRTVALGSVFKLSQTFYKDEENFPYFKNNDTDEYYQFYMSVKAKRSENCIIKANNGEHYFPRMKMSVTINYDYEETIDEDTLVLNTNVSVNNITGQPTEGEGMDAYGIVVDLDNLANLEEYEIDTTWKQIDFFVNLPLNDHKVVSFNSVNVAFETDYSASVTKSYIYRSEIENLSRLRDVEEITQEMTEEDSIYICEPMFGITKNYSALPFTTKQAELITGVTNITQDGIEISRSDSKLSTEIKNSGMAILYDKKMVAQFKEYAEVPVLNVTKKLTAPSIFLNDDNIPSYIEVWDGYASPEYYDDPTVFYDVNPDKLYSKYVYFDDVVMSLWRYGIIRNVRKDKLTIHIRANSNIEADGKVVYPFGVGGFGSKFLISDIKCSVLEIIIDPDVVINMPFVIKNIDGVVKIRGPIDKSDTSYDDGYWEGHQVWNEEIQDYEVRGAAPVLYNIIAHNVHWLEVWGINFSGGHNFPAMSYNDKDHAESLDLVKDGSGGYYMSSKSHPLYGNSYQTVGEFLTDELNYYILDFKGLYSNMSLQEVNDILNKVAIFIGYCWCCDISRCNFPKVVKPSGSYWTGTSYNDIGIYGDHCDCYLFNNQGTLGKYYVNRNKCWFRLPIKEDNELTKPKEENDNAVKPGTPEIEKDVFDCPDDPSNPNNGYNSIVPVIPDVVGTSYIDLMDGIYPGGLIRKGSIEGTALDNCYVGTSRDLVYLGALLYNGAPLNTYDRTISVAGSNLTGYSRIRQNITLKGLKELYSNTDGYFFGASASLPGASYNPNDVSEKNYVGGNDTANKKYSSLYNAMGFSITMPFFRDILDNKELISVKLKLDFETENGLLVEYGNQSAFSSRNNISTYGGGVVASENKGIAFGIRFVYGVGAHLNAGGRDNDPLPETGYIKGHYNMGCGWRAHEVLATKGSINSWYVEASGNDSQHYNKNFAYQGDTSVIEPFYVGVNPYTNDGKLTTSVTIDLGSMITEDLFSEEYMNTYDQDKYNTHLEGWDYVSKSEFFNSLKGFANDKIEYIDVAPIGVWADMGDNSKYPTMDQLRMMNYDLTGDNDESFISLSTSCFRVKNATLIVETKNKEVIQPDTYTITIHYVDTNGNKISDDVKVKQYAGDYNVTNYKNSEKVPENYNFISSYGDPIEGWLDSNKEVTFVYERVPSTYKLTILYKTTANSVIDTYIHNYKEGDSYDVTDLVVNKSISGYEYVSHEGNLSGTVTSDIVITVYYNIVEVKDYSITISYECGDLVIKTDTLYKKFAYGESYDLTSIVKPNLFLEYESGGNTYYFVFRSWLNTYGGMSVVCIDGNGLTGVVEEDMTFILEYRQVFKVQPEIYAPLYTDELPGEYRRYNSGSMTMGINSFVGKLDRTSVNNNTKYYRAIYGDAASSAADNSELPMLKSDENGPANQKGLQALGFEYVVPSNIVENLNENQLYLNITFDTKSYASPKVNYDNHPIYGETYEDGTGCDLNFYVRLTFGRSRSFNGVGTFGSNQENHDTLLFSDYTMLLGPDEIIGFSWVNSENYWGPWHYLTGTSKILSNDDISYFTITGCSASGNGTRTIKINLSNLGYDSSWYNDLKEKYESFGPHHSIGFIDPDTFFNVPLMVKNYLSAVQIIPDQDSSHLSPTTGELDCQCLMVTDISFSNN